MGAARTVVEAPNGLPGTIHDTVAAIEAVGDPLAAARDMTIENRKESRMPHAEDFHADFVNEFFDPQREGYDRELYLTALRDPQDETRPLTARIDGLGLLDGQPAEVSQPLKEWFALWPQATAVELVGLLHDAVSSDPPRRVLFVYRQTDALVEVARADFPGDPLVVVVIQGVHP